MVHFRLLKNVVPSQAKMSVYSLSSQASKLVKLNVDFLLRISVYYSSCIWFVLSWSSWNSILCDDILVELFYYHCWAYRLERLKWFISRLDLILVPTLKVFCSKKGSLKDRWRVDACCLSHPQFVLETMGTLNEHLEGTNSFVNLVCVHISMRRSRLTRNFVLKLDICDEETEKNLQFHFFKTR